MARKNWEKVADREFAALDKDWQEDWADLRKIVEKHQ